jgi:hypothetical protein
MTGYDKSDKFLLNGNQLEEMIWNWRNGRENGTWKVGEVDTYVGGKVGKQAAIGMMQTWTMQKERWIALNRNQRKEVTEKNFSPALWDRCCRVLMPIRYLCASLGSAILELEASPVIMLLQGKPLLLCRDIRVYGLGFRAGPAFIFLLVGCATRVCCSIACSFCNVFEL